MTAVTSRGASPATSTFGPHQRLGDTGWRVWTPGLLRTAGFPVDGLDALRGPGAAHFAARHLDGTATWDEFVAGYERDSDAESARLARIAGDDLLRRAVAWQNRTFFTVLDSIAAGRNRGAKRRQRDRGLAMYWQRYCSKAETIGFFGPAAWTAVGEGEDAVTFRAGPSLTDRSVVFLERWMVAEIGAWMVRQPGARRWFPPMLRPDVHLDAAGARLLVPGRGPVRLRPEDVEVLELADGRRHADDIVYALVGSRGWDPGTARKRVERVLGGLLRSRLLVWDANIPVNHEAEEVLRRRVDAIGDPDLFLRFDAVLREVSEARERIARASTTEDLVAALDALDELFVRVTGQAASHDGGKSYAGRTLCYEDTTRNCELSLGPEFFDRIARPLALVADAAEWFGNRLAQLVEEAVTDLVRDAASTTRGAVTLADVWHQVLGLFWGDDPHPVTTATRELSEKWSEVLGPLDSGRRHVAFSTDELSPRARAAFTTGRGWPHLSVHSPDLQVAARSVDAVNAGEGTVVLGELHACLASLDLALIDWSIGGQGALRDRINAALGGPRQVPLFPPGWRRNSGRFVPTSVGTGERLIGFSRAPVGDRRAVDPAVSITLAEVDGVLVATTPDGRAHRIPELLVVLMSMVAADAFKIGLNQAHSPRLTIDGLVVFRETWRVPLTDLGLPAKPDRHRDYLAVRRWASSLGLPDQVFVKFPDETKPVMVDLTSPVMVLNLVNLARTAHRHAPDAVLTLSESLPAPEDCWLPDAEGRRYVSEFRLHLSKPGSNHESTLDHNLDL